MPKDFVVNEISSYDVYCSMPGFWVFTVGNRKFPARFGILDFRGLPEEY